MQKLLMHISPVSDLKILKPLTFENGKNMLCATDNLAFALMMFAKVDRKQHPQGNFHCSLKDDGVLYVDEKWENALREVFSGKKAYLYFIEKKGAVFNPDVPQFEFYNEMPVKKCIIINDIYVELQKKIESKLLKVNYYNN